MNIQEDNIHMKDYFCNICHKEYSSYKSLWNHKKKYHPIDQELEHPKRKVILEPLLEYACKHCDKKYKFRQSKHTHEKKCQKNIPSSNTIINNNTTINNSTTINNFNITINFNSTEDKEASMRLLSEKEKLKILNQPYYEMIPKLVELLYCGKYDEMNNIKINNLKDKYAFIYKDGVFNCVSKEYALSNLFFNCYWNVAEIYSVYENESKITKNIYKEYNLLLNKIENDQDDKMIVVNHNEKYKNVKTYNKDKILLLLYNKDNK